MQMCASEKSRKRSHAAVCARERKQRYGRMRRTATNAVSTVATWTARVMSKAALAGVATTQGPLRLPTHELDDLVRKWHEPSSSHTC